MEAPNCLLASIINAGQYLVLDQDEAHCSQIKHLEEVLAKESKSWKELGIQLFEEMDVTVRLKANDNILRRGYIKKKLNENIYDVFLTDYGELVSVEKSNIFINVNKSLNNIEPLIFTVRLYGLIASEFILVNGDQKQRVCENWSEESGNFVKELFKINNKIQVKIMLVYGDVVYGDIIVIDDNGRNLSLRKLLLCQQFCVYSETYFLRKVFNVSRHSYESGNTVKKASNCRGNFTCSEQKLIKTKLISLGCSEVKNEVLDSSRNVQQELETAMERPLYLEHDSKSVISAGKCKDSSHLKSISELSVAYEEGAETQNSSWETISPPQTWHYRRNKNLAKTESEFDEMFFINNPLMRKSEPAIVSNGLSENEENTSEGNTLNRNTVKCSLQKKNEYAAPLVLCNGSSIEPVDKFKDLSIEIDTKQNIESWGRFNDLSPLQRWSVPAMLSRNDVVVIGSFKTGKTLSYIITVIDFVKKMTNLKVPDGNGPLGVIVCSSSGVAEKIYQTCLSLTTTFAGNLGVSLKIVLAYAGYHEKKGMVNLTNGCHILISTPNSLVRLMELPVVTNFERLSHLVVDEIDVVCEKPFNKCIFKILQMAELQRSKGRRCQMIFCGERWTPNVEALVKLYCKSYSLIIGSYKEAAICARIKPKVYYIKKEHKLNILYDEICNLIGKYKVLIICEKSHDAIAINNYLHSRGIDSALFDENTSFDQCKEVHSAWNNFQAVVATDGIIGELKIHDADVLVSYGLTQKSKTNFFLRYSTIVTNCISYDFTSQELIRSVKSNLIFLDEECLHQLPQIVDFVIRLGGQIPRICLEKCHEIQTKLEKLKTTPICENLLVMGRCRNFKNCPQRHAFTKARDLPTDDLLVGSSITFLVAKVHNATSFSVKLLEQLDVNGKKRKFDECADLHQKIMDHYLSEENRKVCARPKIGNICGVQCYSQLRLVFRRGEILEYVENDKYHQPTKVNVKLIDVGETMQLKTTELYELPEALASISPQVMEVKLIGVQPRDFDITWNKETNHFMKNIMLQTLDKEQSWCGNVVLALKNVLFLNHVALRRYLPDVKINIIEIVLHKKLLNSQLAVKNIEHLPVLIKLCVEAGIRVPKNGDMKSECTVDRPQWAFLEEGYIPVNLAALEKPATIYLQCKKFVALLEALEDDCQLEVRIKKQGHKIIKSEDVLPNLSVGMFCLAQRNKKWSRGKIESETDAAFGVRFVDYGEFNLVEKENVYALSQTLLKRLPCQAIECNLVGVVPREDCISDVLKEIRDFSAESGTLFAYWHSRDLVPQKLGGRKYKLNLLNSEGLSLSKYLADRNLVRIVDDEKEFVKNVPDIKSEIRDAMSSDHGDESELNLENSLELKSADDSTLPGLCERLSLMSDNLFENESELLFLKQVASKIFRPSETSGQVKQKLDQNVQSLSSQESSQNCGDNEVTGFGSTFRPKINFERLLNFHRMLKVEENRKPELKIKEGVLTPQVLWHQDHIFIYLKILLSNIVKYKCECTVTNILFRCFLEEKVYAVDLKLYGAINPKETEIVPKTFHVNIILRKNFYCIWPRLHRDEGKHHWIHPDVEKLKVEETIDFDIIERAKRNIEAGILEEGIRTSDIRPYDSDDSDDEEFSDN